MTAFFAIVGAATLSSVLTAAEPATLTGKVVSVHDGDTLRVLDAGGTQHKVRLQGIDSPETRQAFGTKARNRLADLTLGKSVTVRVHGRDRYGRTLGTVEAAGQDVNRQNRRQGRGQEIQIKGQRVPWWLRAWRGTTPGTAKMQGWPEPSVMPEPLTVGYGPTRHPWHRGRGGPVRRTARVRR